jgi:SAM-dependent methyltransferase
MRQTLVNHGWGGAIRRAGDALRNRARPGAGGLGWLDTAHHEFDRRYGVDTSGLIWSVNLATGSPSDRWNTAYYAIPPSVFSRVMAELPPELVAGATFLDLGCGKGRALLLASGYPFGRIIGVEIAPQLHATACDNVRRYQALRDEALQAESRQDEAPRDATGGVRRPPIEIRLADAATLPLPEGPLVLYLYNPFCRPVLARVLANLEQSLRESPRPAAVVYINHEVRDLLDGAPFLERVWMATVAVDAEDRLADRVGSSAEDCAILSIPAALRPQR